MVVCVDVGNTNIVFGAYKEDALLFTSRIQTELGKTADQYAIAFSAILQLYHCADVPCEGAIISSVVPPLQTTLKTALSRLRGCRVLVVGPGVKTGLNIKIDDPATLGADLVANCVAALAGYPLPCIVLDMGTATSFTVLNEKGVMVGGSILPGVLISLEALCRETALLTNIALTSPAHTIGKNTADCMVSGAMLGTAAMIDGMVERIEAELGSPCTVVGTGELAVGILPLCRREIIHDEHLLLNGLRLLYRRNTKQAKTV